jgi:DNA-directed RNA polymerase specialized sigma24 family protein
VTPSFIPALSPASLAALTERIAVGDRSALQQLYDALRVPLHDEVSRTLTGTGDVRAVLHASIVEVWWMARFHTTAGDDTEAWILGIAARRAAERCSVSRHTAQLDLDDETSRLTFEGLLGEPLRVPRPEPASVSDGPPETANRR